LNKVESPTVQGLCQEVQYGPRVKSFVTYSNVHQLLPYKRLTKMVYDLFGLEISQGSVSNFNKQAQKGVRPYIDLAWHKFITASKLIHSDETGCIVNKKLHWVHVYSDSLKTLLFGHAKRGKEAMEEIAILNQTQATVVHDRFHSYMGYDHIEHGLCNAHILREVKAIGSLTSTDWPDQIKQILLEAKEKKERKPLTHRQIKRFVNRYEAVLRKQRAHYQIKENETLQNNTTRGKPKRSKDHNLFIALWKYRTMILRYITDPNVPFDNNLAERDFRMLKVKMKISNQFKTLEWLNVHNDIRSYISAAIKQKRNVFDCIYQTFVDPKFAATLAV
jgi:transposase